MRLRDLIHYHADPSSGRVPIADVPDPHGGSDPDPAPGTGLEPEVTPPEPAAEPTTPDSGGGPPGAIPYSRFQEVNERRKAVEDAYRPYADLSAQGYEADDLHRLVQWELEFTQDPATAWLATAETIMDRLPESVREAIEVAKGTPTPPAPDGAPPDGPPPASDDGEPPSWFKPYAEDLEARQQRDREAAEAQATADANARGAELLDQMISGWKEMDKKQGIVTPERSIITHIVAAAKQTDDPVKALTDAREGFLEEREAILKGEIIPGGSGGPRPVPRGGSGGTLPRNAPPPAKTLGEASKRAMAALRDGALPAQEE